MRSLIRPRTPLTRIEPVVGRPDRARPEPADASLPTAADSGDGPARPPTAAGLWRRLGGGAESSGDGANASPAADARFGQPAPPPGHATSANRGRRDPAPSRVVYRLQRIWLTPLYRRLLRLGLPVFVLTLALGLTLRDPDRRQAFVAWGEGLRSAVAERPEFMITRLRIDGASPETAEALRQTLALNLPRSSFELDLDALRDKAAAIDAISSVALYLRQGGVLEAVVSERRPAVVWRNTTGIGTLDAQGHPVAQLLSRLERPDLPLIVGEGAEHQVRQALELYAAAGPLRGRMRGLIRVGDRRWDAIVDPAIRLMLPETDPVAALEQIVALQVAQGLLDRDVVAVDLRNPARPTVRMGEAAAQTYRENAALIMGALKQ